MEQSQKKEDIIKRLKQEMLLIQGFKPVSPGMSGIGLGAIESAFPHGVFPKAAIHEFIIAEPEHAAASLGFLAGLLNITMKPNSTCLYISRGRILFPAALNTFGLAADKVIFVDLEREKDVLWVMEEALKCKGISAVVAEVASINFAQSRRLQLALEKTEVTGFVLRTDAARIATTTCVARWLITPMASEQPAGLPGIGFPCWKVELLRVRNGNPGSWKLAWLDGKFQTITEKPVTDQQKLRIG